MEQYGAPVPPPYDDPENWPFKWCSFDDARGWVTRIRSAGSHEGKLIAKEIGKSWSSVKRAVRWYLVSVGEYEPDTWLAYERRRKAEGRRYFLELMAKRDEENGLTNQEIKQARATIAHERATRDEDLHIASSYSEDSDRRERRRELQRKLNQKNRAAL
jgi:dTDP-4-dehydrorhamnose 3,5-epimerase-like enzyme